jgi:hypothetical protein
LRAVIDTNSNFRRKLSAQASRWTGSQSDRFSQPVCELPIIQVGAGERPHIVDEAESALLQSGQPIFQRGGSLVRLLTDTLPAANDGQIVAARFRPMCAHSMIDSMGRAATFQRFDKRQQEWVSRDPPQKVAISSSFGKELGVCHLS